MAWIAFPIFGGWAIRAYGATLTSDASFLLGLFLLIAQGILTYDLMLRNATLDVAATVPVPTSSIRRAFRVQGLLVLGSLLTAGFIALSATDRSNPDTWAGFVHIVLPLWVGIPVYCAALCWLAHGTTTPEHKKRVGEMLGKDLLPADAATIIYGLSVVYGLLGAYSLVLHFVLRAWSDTGNATALVIVSGGGCIASIAAVLWIDRVGMAYVHKASAHLRHLDKNGLLLATPHQKGSARILKSKTKPVSWTIIAPQILRRRPLEPLFIAGLLWAITLHSDAPLWQAMMFPLTLGLWLDLPDRWKRDKLVTAQSLNLLGHHSSFEKRPLALPALSISLGVSILSFACVFFLGAGLERGLYLTGIMFAASVSGGFIFGVLLKDSWGALRFPTLVVLTALGIFGGMVVS
jgi:hypothetical protein